MAGTKEFMEEVHKYECLYNKCCKDYKDKYSWLQSHKPSLNVTKTEYMFIATQFELDNMWVLIFSILIGDKPIKSVKSPNCLAIDLDEKVAWHEQINNLSTKIRRSINGQKQARQFVSRKTLLLFHNLLIQPYFYYCDTVWGKDYPLDYKISNIALLE